MCFPRKWSLPINTFRFSRNRLAVHLFLFQTTAWLNNFEDLKNVYPRILCCTEPSIGELLRSLKLQNVASGTSHENSNNIKHSTGRNKLPAEAKEALYPTEYFAILEPRIDDFYFVQKHRSAHFEPRKLCSVLSDWGAIASAKRTPSCG